jgi:hypothetical protein
VAPAAAGHPGNAYHQTNLVADLPGLAQLTDPDLVNPWGLAAGPTTPVWVADNGTDRATLYPGFVNGSPISKAPLVVTIPGGAPTGQLFNPTPGFEVGSGAARGPALFLFDSEAGLVSGWNPACRRPRRPPRPRSAPACPTPATRGWPSPPPRPGPCWTPPTSTAAGSTSSTRAWTGSGCRAGSATPSSPAARRVPWTAAP